MDIKNKYSVSYKCIILILSIFLFAGTLEYSLGQANNGEQLPSGLSEYSQSNYSETLIKNINIKKNYWLPAVEVVGLNMSLWAYHRYLSAEGWSDISWKSIKRNFESGFEWDVDGYLMNQFWHPYHGSNYFNIARSNGLTFWESAPYALGGSLMWEYFMENEPPSYNDIVNTPITGIILGEISYRISDLIIDESTTGSERVFREFFSTLVDPMRGFNRILRGDMWKAGEANEPAEYHLIVSSGIHNLFLSSKLNDSKSYAAIRADLNYGDLFDVDSHKNPFDYFTLHVELNIAPDDNIAGIFASGVIWDGKLKLFENSKNIIGIYKEVDIHINTIYKLSATSLSSQLINTVPLSSSLTLQNYLGLSAILMGATNSQYASELGKDYNIGPGASGKVGAHLLIKNFGELYINYKRYWIHTLSGADGEEFVGLLNIGINYNLFAENSIGLDLLLYERFGEYIDYPNTRDANSAVRFYYKHSF